MNMTWTQPGIWLIKRLRLPAKLSLVVVLLLVPLLVFMVNLVQRESNDLALTRSELKGTEIASPLLDTITQVQRHRGLSNMVYAGNPAAAVPIEQTRAALTKSVQQAAEVVTRYPELKLDTEWSALQRRLKELPDAAVAAGSAGASFSLHSALVFDLRLFLWLVGERSALLFEPDPAIYLMADLLISRMVPVTEQIGRLRGLGAGELSKPARDDAGAARVLQLADVLKDLMVEQQFAFKVLETYGVKGLDSTKALDTTRQFLDLARAAFAKDAPPQDSAAYFAAGTQAIEGFLALQLQLRERVEQSLQARAELLQLRRAATIAGLVFALLLMSYLLACMYLQFIGDLRRVIYAMGQVASGNLQVAATPRSSDEIGDIADKLRQMIVGVSKMVAMVGSDAALVTAAGRSLGQGNRDLSDRTEQQAANLEETAASVQELTSTVARNAQTASEVNAQAIAVREIAEAGARSMDGAVQSVEGIQASARRMNEIIGVIDGLAFQTNILALNAAVEAARAGDQGRGFAVVATEVRMLAKRSADSAREIRNLIQTSSTQVEGSVAQIKTAGDGIAKVVQGIRAVSSQITQISEASAEQSTGVQEISAAVRQLDEITQQNAQMVERSVAQSNSLERRAAVLIEAVSGFHLLQGTAPEAALLVGKAVEQYAASGTRDAYLRALTARENGFHDRDMYVFVLDASGRYLAFGGNPAKVGTRVHDVPGIDGDKLLRAIITQADEGPGWVEYDITNPATGQVQTKISFVQQIDGMYLGCGVYKNLVGT